ncbi:hypothetical protein C8F04DRAFT_1183179 [Mycena alexandri]|uniref:Uncharacterized protein n=1 Tax=Mycena alexandri TaxID=1745969 RepID=A0AAD6SWB6_9AGAR|nr:hypothetical protein C8F04DRAFT_1183179 [Mycena alexandri]
MYIGDDHWLIFPSPSREGGNIREMVNHRGKLSCRFVSGDRFPGGLSLKAAVGDPEPDQTATTYHAVVTWCYVLEGKPRHSSSSVLDAMWRKSFSTVTYFEHYASGEAVPFKSLVTCDPPNQGGAGSVLATLSEIGDGTCCMHSSYAPPHAIWFNYNWVGYIILPLGRTHRRMVHMRIRPQVNHSEVATCSASETGSAGAIAKLGTRLV